MSDRTYLYAIADASAMDVPDESGVKDASVRALSHDDLAAVVSDAPDGKLRPRRRHLKAHHDLLKTLMAEATVLPMAFGVLANSEEQVQSFLRSHAGTLRAQLDQVRGHAEVGLRVKWAVDDIFEYFVETDDDLRELRDAVFGDDREPSRQEKIQVGEEFEARLQQARDAHEATVRDHMAAVCRDIAADDPKDETEVMNLACLVPRDEMDAFEEALMDAAGEFSDDFAFTYTDPMAPYSFADVAFEGVQA
jgi:hypothetical protein